MKMLRVYVVLIVDLSAFMMRPIHYAKPVQLWYMIKLFRFSGEAMNILLPHTNRWVNIVIMHERKVKVATTKGHGLPKKIAISPVRLSEIFAKKFGRLSVCPKNFENFRSYVRNFPKKMQAGRIFNYPTNINIFKRTINVERFYVRKSYC